MKQSHPPQPSTIIRKTTINHLNLGKNNIFFYRIFCYTDIRFVNNIKEYFHEGWKLLTNSTIVNGIKNFAFDLAKACIYDFDMIIRQKFVMTLAITSGGNV